MAVLAGDTFVDTNGVALPAHTPTGPNAGLSWSRSSFSTLDLLIGGNGIYNPNATAASLNAVLNKSGAAWPADVSIAFDLHFFTDLTNALVKGVLARVAATTDASYGVIYNGSSHAWFLVVYSAANPPVASTLISIGYPYPGDGVVDHMIFEVEGTALRLYKNGVLFLSATDGTITAAGPPAVRGTGATSAEAAATGKHIENLVVSDSMLYKPPITARRPYRSRSPGQSV